MIKGKDWKYTNYVADKNDIDARNSIIEDTIKNTNYIKELEEKERDQYLVELGFHNGCAWMKDKLAEDQISDWINFKLTLPPANVRILFFIKQKHVKCQTVGSYYKDENFIHCDYCDTTVYVEDVVAWKYLPSDPEKV